MHSSNSFLRHISLAVVFASVAISIHAQDDADSDWNHFGFNARAAFNIKAKFADGSLVPLPPGPGSGAVNRNYNDGFVNVDSSGNAGGKTWNWGYNNASQISGGNVLMHATGSTSSTLEKTDDPNLGFDFNYIHDIGHYGWGQLGLKIAFGYTHIQIADNDPITSGLENVTDTYALNGVVPPAAPYSGSFSGPGPVLSSSPISRTISGAGGSAVSANHGIDASLFDLRLGPSVNVKLWKRLTFQASGGLALGIVDSDFTFSEIAGHVQAQGESKSTGFEPGAYVEGGFSWRFSHGFSIYTGAQFEYLSDFQQSSGARSAQLKLGQTIFYELGFGWEF